MQELMLHSGSEKVRRSDLMQIPLPMQTKSYKPVSHVHIAELIAEEAYRRNYSIASEEYGLTNDGQKMFGILRFHHNNHPEHTRALGFRNSYDKSLAVGLTVGLSVLVCDNLCFGGETTINRKHTSGIAIEELIPEAFECLSYQFERLEENVEKLKYEYMPLSTAKLKIVKAAENKVIPSCDILPVLDEYKNPKYEEFSDRNSWSLYNSFTEIAKKYSPTRADQCYKRLGQLFQLT